MFSQGSICNLCILVFITETDLIAFKILDMPGSCAGSLSMPGLWIQVVGCVCLHVSKGVWLCVHVLACKY